MYCRCFAAHAEEVQVAAVDDGAMTVLQKSLAVVRNQSKPIANALLVYQPGRQVCAKVDSFLLAAQSSRQRLTNFGACVKQCEEFEHLSDVEWSVRGITPVHTAFVSIGAVFQQMNEKELACDLNDVSRCWSMVSTWRRSTLKAAWQVYIGFLEEDPVFKVETFEELKELVCKMCRAVLGFCRAEVAPCEHIDSKTAFAQAIEFFNHVQRAKQVAQGSVVWNEDHCKFLHDVFHKFEIHNVWVQYLVKEPENPVKFTAQKECLLDRVLDVCYNLDIRRKLLSFSATKQNLQVELQTFAAHIPEEYTRGELPKEFLDFASPEFVNKVSSSGDNVLCQQVSFILAHHNMVKHAAELAALRGGALGQPGAETPIEANTVSLVSGLRVKILDATVHGKRCAQADFFSQSASAGVPHLSTLDGLLDAENLSQACLSKASAELDVWTVAWSDVVTIECEIVFRGIPDGWSLVKDTLLDDANHAIVQAMVGNQHYLAMASALATLSGYVPALKPIKSDGCGMFLSLEVSQRCKQAIEQGTETLGITYALYKLKFVIAKEKPGKARRDMVKELREEVRSKGITNMGRSLEDEAARLSV